MESVACDGMESRRRREWHHASACILSATGCMLHIGECRCFMACKRRISLKPSSHFERSAFFISKSSIYCTLIYFLVLLVMKVPFKLTEKEAIYEKTGQAAA